MVVDDAIVVRGLIVRWLQEQPDLAVVAALRTGAEAVAQVETVAPDVVVLDVEMPDLDGLSALPLLLKKRPGLVAIMASTATRRNAEVSLKALTLGAADYITKPDTLRGVTTSAEFRDQLIAKVRTLGCRAREQLGLGQDSCLASLQPAPAAPLHRAERGAFSVRRFGNRKPCALLIGASTGGPQALTTLLASCGPLLERVPVLVVQHMPRTFTTVFAEHLSAATGHAVREAREGETARRGTVYIAPGGLHMQVRHRHGEPVIKLDDGVPINFCKPAVDPLFCTAAAAWGGGVLAVILTGMGCDGTAGAEAIVAHGGSVIAQDEASSVVWGMPGCAAHAGLCAAVLPLEQIAEAVMRQFSGVIA